MATCPELIQQIERNEDITLNQDLKCQMNEWYPEYSATLNGNGHKLEITIINKENKASGLFSKLTGEVKNLHLIANIEAISHIGTIAGIAENALITNNTIQSNIKGHSIIGGIVGLTNNSNIVNTNSQTEIKATREIGGAIGVQFSGTLKSSNIEANIQAEEAAGSLIGIAFGSIEDTQANSNLNNLIGINRNAKITTNEYILINNNKRESYYLNSQINFDYSFFLNNVGVANANCKLIIPELAINEVMEYKKSYQVSKSFGTKGTYEYTISCDYNDHIEIVKSNITIFTVENNPKIIDEQSFLKLINSPNPKEYTDLALKTLNTRLEYLDKVNIENLDLNKIEIEDNYISIPDDVIHPSLRKSYNNKPIAKIIFEKANCNEFALRYIKDDSKFQINNRAGTIVAESIDATEGKGVCKDQSICRNFECKDQTLTVEVMHFSKYILEARPSVFSKILENKFILYVLIFGATIIFVLKRE